MVEGGESFNIVMVHSLIGLALLLLMGSAHKHPELLACRESNDPEQCRSVCRICMHHSPVACNFCSLDRASYPQERHAGEITVWTSRVLGGEQVVWRTWKLSEVGQTAFETPLMSLPSTLVR